VNWSLLVVLLMLVAAGAPAQWHPATGPLGGNMSAGAIDPLDADSVYAAGGGSLWHSADGGKTWHRVDGLPGGPGQRNISAIAISRDKDGPIILGPTPLIISRDRGKTWQQKGGPEGFAPDGCLYAGPAGLRVFYAADPDMIARSDDDGETWKVLGGRPDKEHGIERFVADRFDADTISYLYRVEDRTVFVLSRDGGKSFRNVPFPEGEDCAASVSTDPDDKTVLYLCTQKHGWGRGSEKRYFYSFDDGDSWEPFWNPAADAEPDPATLDKLQRVFPDMIPSPVPVWGGWPLYRSELAWSEDKPGRVLGMFAGRVFRSDDFGQHWELAVDGLVATAVERIVFDPNDPKAAYCSGGTSLWRTADRGKTWDRMPVGENWAIAGIAFPPDGKHVFVISDGIWRATAEGQEWDNVWPAEDPNSCPMALFFRSEEAVDGKAVDVYVAVGNGFVLESKDGGATWAKAGDNNLDLSRSWFCRDFAQRRVSGEETWYAHGIYHPLLVSTDHGRTWQAHEIAGCQHFAAWAVSTDGAVWIAADGKLKLVWWQLKEAPAPAPGEGLPGITAIACDPADSRAAYVARSNGQILRTTDSAVSFTVLEGGPSGVQIACLAVSPHDGALWVATSGDGVWILDKPKEQPGKPVSE